MRKVTSGGGWAAIGYTFKRAWETGDGGIPLIRRMFSRNTCKTCAVGMGGQQGGMTNEAGHFPEFCKKSVQAMAADMQPPIEDEFFDKHSIDELARLSPRELENLGRLSYPLVRNSGSRHFRRMGWDEALDRIALALRRTYPNRTFFYSSGRSSNEAAFLLQWLARVYGTNNINNCSYYCHQASGVGLGQSIGSGTATVTLEDLDHADFALLIGANPASNHPRLVTQLVKMRERGGTVVVVNPIREVGLERFHVPSMPKSLLFGSQVSDLYVQPRIGGDIALLKGMLKVVIAERALDSEFIESHTTGFPQLLEQLEQESIHELAANAGVPASTIIELGRMYAASKNAILMWAMGITHHEHGVDNVLAIVNLALARGMVGRPYAGLLPIRGHSNVQGIGSVGFAPELKAGFLTAMQELYGLKLPTEQGLDSMQSIHAAHRGAIDTALFMGGNFYAANPDLAYAAKALGRIRTTIHISTKLNQGHVCVTPLRPESDVFVLPTCVRDEELQSTTQESMFSFVRMSDGRVIAPINEIRSEVDIITSIGARLLPSDGPIDFNALRNHSEIRQVMAQVVPGYQKIGEMGRTKEEFLVEGRVRHQRKFPFPDGKSRFSVINTPTDTLGSTELRLMTIRSEGQFNTVVYEEHDRYRNQPNRQVIMMNALDMTAMHLIEGDKVTVHSDVGTLRDIRVAKFDISRGSSAMYYPEANALVNTNVDPKSGTPAFKNVKITIIAEQPRARVDRDDSNVRLSRMAGHPIGVSVGFLAGALLSTMVFGSLWRNGIARNMGIDWVVGANENTDDELTDGGPYIAGQTFRSKRM